MAHLRGVGIDFIMDETHCCTCSLICTAFKSVIRVEKKKREMHLWNWGWGHQVCSSWCGCQWRGWGETLRTARVRKENLKGRKGTYMWNSSGNVCKPEAHVFAFGLCCCTWGSEDERATVKVKVFGYNTYIQIHMIRYHHPFKLPQSTIFWLRDLASLDFNTYMHQICVQDRCCPVFVCICLHGVFSLVLQQLA